MNGTQLISVSKDDVARIIGEWWRQFEADPGAFGQGPDLKGEGSAETFFRIAVELGIALPPAVENPQSAIPDPQ